MIATPPPTPRSPEVEFVQETQRQNVDAGPSQQRKGKRVHKKKAPDEPREKQNQKLWSPDEQMALARAWLEVTEDPKEGIHFFNI